MPVVLKIELVVGIPVGGNGGIFRLCFGNGRFQIFLQRRPGKLYIFLLLLLVQQDFRIFRFRLLGEIGTAHEKNRGQQGCCRRSDDAENPFRTKPFLFGMCGQGFFRRRIYGKWGLFQLLRNLQGFHGPRLLLRTFDSVYHIFFFSPSGENCLKNS